MGRLSRIIYANFVSGPERWGQEGLPEPGQAEQGMLNTRRRMTQTDSPHRWV